VSSLSPLCFDHINQPTNQPTNQNISQMHHSGLKSVYVDETVVDMGLCPNAAVSAFDQMLWWRGCIEMFLHRFILGNETHQRLNTRRRNFKETHYEEIEEEPIVDAFIDDEISRKKHRNDRSEPQFNDFEEESVIPMASAKVEDPNEAFESEFITFDSPRTKDSFYRRTFYWQIQFEPFAFLTALLYAICVLIALVSDAVCSLFFSLSFFSSSRSKD